MTDLKPFIDAAAARFGLSPAILQAYAQAESGGNPTLQGPMTRHGWRAQGAMQMAPDTYAEMAKKHNLGADPMNPADNVMAGAGYLREMTDKFGPDPETVALAWNAGPGYAQQYLAGKKGMPEQTKELFSRIRQNLADPAKAGAPYAGPQGPRGAVMPPQLAAALRDPAKMQAAAPPPGLLASFGDSAAAAKSPGSGLAGLLSDDDAMTGALAALAPLAGPSTQRVGIGQVLAALAGGIGAGRQAGAQRQLQGMMTQLAVGERMDKIAAERRQAAAAEAYAQKLEAMGQHQLAAAVRGDPATMKEVAGHEAQAAFPKPLSPGERFKTVGDSLVDVATGRPIYQANEKADKAQFDKEHTLRAGFDGLQPVKNFRESMPVYQSMLDAKDRDNATADLNLIYGLAKIFDPASVVRESELSMVVKSGSPAERLLGEFNYIANGGRLTPDRRAELLKEASSRMQGHKDLYDGLAAGYSKIAGDYGLDSNRVVTPMPMLPAWPPAQAGAKNPASGMGQAAPAQRAMLNGRMISVQNGGWVFDDDGSPVAGATQ